MRSVLSAWWTGLAFWLASGVVVAAVLTFLMSLLLMGIPHGWDTATSLADIGLRFSWAARFVIPVAVGAHVVTWLCIRDRTPGRDGLHR